MFIRELDVPESEIEATIEKYKSDPWEQKYQCLCYWLNDRADQASFEQLIDVARNSGQLKLVNYIESILRGVYGTCDLPRAVFGCQCFVVHNYICLNISVARVKSQVKSGVYFGYT